MMRKHRHLLSSGEEKLVAVCGVWCAVCCVMCDGAGCVWERWRQTKTSCSAFSKFLMVPAQNALSLPRNPGMGTAWMPGGSGSSREKSQGERKKLPTSVMAGLEAHHPPSLAVSSLLLSETLHIPFPRYLLPQIFPIPGSAHFAVFSSHNSVLSRHKQSSIL